MSSEYPPNSRKAKTAPPEEPKRVERVTSGQAVRRKKGLGRQFKETLVAGDVRGALGYSMTTVVVPMIKDMLTESFHSSIDRWVYGDSRPGRRSPPPMGYPTAGHVAYNRVNQGPPQSSPMGRPPGSTTGMVSRQARARHDFGEIVIPSRAEAEEVIDRLFDLLSRYGSASVADLYELTGIQSQHTDHKWGWTGLQGARAARIRSGGFLLELPEPHPLD